MFTIIGGDNVEYGPVPASQVRAWMAGGRANLQTKAKKLGEDDWKTLGDFPEFSPAAAVPPPTTDGVTSSASAETLSPAGGLPARAAKLRVGDCLNCGWNLWMKYFGQVVRATFVLFAIYAAIVFTSLASAHLALALAFLLGGMLTAGMFRYTLKLLRDEPASLSDLFAGFSEAPRPLILASILIGLVSELPEILKQGGVAPSAPPASPVYWAVQLLVVYLCVGWIFTYPLILEKRLSFWPAMQASRHAVRGNWWRLFLLVIVAMLLSVMGVLALFVGIFLTAPLYFCTLACAYDALCNPKK